MAARSGTVIAFPRLAGCALAWTLLQFGLNLVWEVVQLPLYALGPYEPWPASGYAVLHCTVGDAGIALGSFLMAAAVTHRFDWPLHRPLAGIVTAITVSLAYTVWAEWRNVYVLGSWAYAPSMPTIQGIGIAPLAQWVVLPLIALGLMRFPAVRRRLEATPSLRQLPEDT